MAASGSEIKSILELDISHFKRNITSAINDIRKLETSVKSMTNTFGKSNTNMGNASQSIDKVKNSSNYAQQHLAKLDQRIGEAKASFGGLTQSTQKTTQGFDNVTNSGKKTSTQFENTKKSTDSLKTSFGALQMAAGFLAVTLAMQVGTAIMDIANSAINSIPKIQIMAKGMNWTAQETQKFIDKGKELQSTYRKIDINTVTSEVAKMARMYNLSNEEATKFIETAAIFNSAMAEEGRTARDSSLALKDFIDQGVGWQRRLGELGVTAENLKATGLWHGDPNDKKGLIGALQKVMESRQLDKMAKEITNIDDAIKVLTISGGQLLAAVLIPLTPIIYAVVSALADIAYVISGVIGWFGKVFDMTPGWGKLALGIGAVSTALILAIPKIKAYIFSMLGATGTQGKFITTLKASATAWITNLFGLNANTVANYGLFSSLVALATGESVATVATWSFTASVRELTLALLTNPIFLVVAAIGVAIYAIYEIGRAMKWWTDISSMGSAVMEGLTRLWTAFANSPQIKGVIKFFTDIGNSIKDFINTIFPLESAWNSLFGSMGNGGNFDIVQAIINSFDWLGKQLGNLWNIISNNPIAKFAFDILTLGNPLVFIITHFEWVKKTVTDVYNQISNLVKNNPLLNILSWLNPVTILLFHLKDLKQIFSALKQAWDNFANSTEGKALFTELNNLWGQLSLAGNELMKSLQMLWNALFPPEQQSGGGVKETVSSTGKAIKEVNPYLETAKQVISALAWVIKNIFVPMLVGAITYINIFKSIIKGVSDIVLWVRAEIGLLIAIFTNLPQTISNAGSSLEQWFLNLPYTIGYALGSIIRFFLDLPLKISEALIQLITSLTNFSTDLLAKGQESGSNFVTGTISFIKQLPSRFYTWLTSTASKIPGWASNIVSRGRSAGTQFVTNIISIIKGLPGKFIEELRKITMSILNVAKDWYNAAKNAGKNAVKGLLDGLQRKSPGKMYKEMKSELKAVNDEIMDQGVNLFFSAKTMSSKIVEGFGNPQLNIGMGMENMDGTQLEQLNAISNQLNTNMLGNIQNNATDIKKINDKSTKDANQSFGILTTGLTNTFNNLSDETKTTFTGIGDTTQSTLENMQNKTTTNIKNIQTSWHGMQTALINSASHIRQKTGDHINKLQNNMASFWKKVKNPVLLLSGAAGPGNIRNARDGSKTNFAKSIIRSNGSYAGSPNLSKNERFSDKLLKLLSSSPETIDCGNPNGCYAGWTLNNWTPTLKKNIGSWKTNFGGIWDQYLNVGKFENSNFPVKGNSRAYESLALDMIGKTFYKFYYNSQGGSLASIYSSGRFNCWDGAHILMSLADSFGLSSSLVHGFWGSVPHVWANVQGVGNIDATAIQKSRGTSKFSSMAHAGPTPQSYTEVNSGESSNVTINQGNIIITGNINGVDDLESRMAVEREKIMKETRKEMIKILSPNSKTGGW